MLNNNESPSELATVDDIVHYFTMKKRLHLRNYNYRPTPVTDKHLQESLELCLKYGITPVSLVQVAYDNCGRPQYFSTEHLCNKSMHERLKQAFVYQSDTEDSDSGIHYNEFKIAVTNETLSYEGRWEFQAYKLQRLVAAGWTRNQVLMDTSNKLHAWFRILYTEEPIPEVIAKYKEIARKEMNPRLRAFIQSRNLPERRIINA